MWQTVALRPRKRSFVPSPPSGKILLMNRGALHDKPNQRLARVNPFLRLCAELFGLKVGVREGCRRKLKRHMPEHGETL